MRNWDEVAWTPFQHATTRDPHPLNDIDPPAAVLINSRYQVTVYLRPPVEPFGPIAHLSIKTHDRSPRHDWRDLQRIKNEICGTECDAVEIYPAESKLVDTSNQFHLWVFGSDYKIPFGFNERLVGDGNWQKSVQRPWPAGERPADCLTPDDYQRRIDTALARSAAAGRVHDGPDRSTVAQDVLSK